jgi:hypothetical protein
MHTWGENWLGIQNQLLGNYQKVNLLYWEVKRMLKVYAISGEEKSLLFLELSFGNINFYSLIPW